MWQGDQESLIKWKVLHITIFTCKHTLFCGMGGGVYDLDQCNCHTYGLSTCFEWNV